MSKAKGSGTWHSSEPPGQAEGLKQSQSSAKNNPVMWPGARTPVLVQVMHKLHLTYFIH